MSGRTPIGVVPWSTDFIQVLAARLGEPGRLSRLGATRVVFPHNRPARHLRAALAALPGRPRPCLLPRMHSLDEFLKTLRQELSPDPLHRAGRLDRIGLLHGIVRELGLAGGPLSGLDATAREFFPWGARLSGLLEEMAGQGVRPAALHNLAGEVSPWAEALLAQLDAIGTRYQAELDARGWTTPGLDARWLAAHRDEAAAALGGQDLVFAGFHALSGSEEQLLQHLWEHAGAEFLWHTNPALATGGAADWAAQEHARWLARWRARVELLAEAPDTTPQRRRFYEGFDLHSQLSVLERELAELPDASSTAVILPDPAALVPVMHHLPEHAGAEVNISMGYPLRRSSLAQLVETILVLHENAAGEGETARYAWRDLIALSRHPLLRLLRVEGPEGDETPLKSAYVAWERHIRTGGAMQSPGQWLFAYDAETVRAPEQDVRALHGEVLAACFVNFQAVGTLRQAGQALDALCTLLRRRGGDVWKRHLIDAECLLRLWQSVVPELTGSILADEPYGRKLVFLMLRHLIEAERVSFEPEPLAGMQVLGMLESRLLSFERLFILDATEDKLPGVSPPDPLLPDPLRQALGLPGRRERDNVAAHNFFRLLAGAREVTLFYQAGVKPGALEGKSERSRYVEQLLWEQERRQGALIKAVPAGPGDMTGGAPLIAVNFPVRPIHPHQPPVVLTPALRTRLALRLANKGVTPSNLEVWLTCPKKAFYAQVLGLRPMQEVAEDGDRARFGEIMHRVLKDFLSPHLGRSIHGVMLDARELIAGFELALEAEAFSQELPFDARTVLRAAGRERLRRFLANLPPTAVVALEHEALTRLPVAGMEETASAAGLVELKGRIDRIDLRGGGHVVLDYKTGSVKSGGAAAWLDDGLFGRMAASLEAEACGEPEAGALFQELAASGMDVQLPLYLHLLASDTAFAPENAAWVELRKDGTERPLFAADVTPEARQTVLRQRAPLFVRFILGRMLAAPELPAQAGRHCQWCDYQGPCRA